MQQMTHKDARKRLKRYYLFVECLKLDGIREEEIDALDAEELIPARSSTDYSNSDMPRGSNVDGSAAETLILHYVEMLSDIRNTRAAIHALKITQQVFIDYRFKIGWSFARLVREMKPHGLYTSETGMRRYEKEVLEAFIEALGYEVLTGAHQETLARPSNFK